jgi:hypothetical protein
VGSELGPVLGEVDALVAAGELARVAVVAEAVERGEPAAGSVAMAPVAWALAWAPSLRAGGAGQAVALARDFAKPVNAPVLAAVEQGRIPIRSAAVVIAEADRLRPRLAEGADEPVMEGLISLAEREGPRGCRRLRPALLARHGIDGELQAEHDAHRQHLALSRPVSDGLGLHEYRLLLDTEGMAALEAAVGPLSAARPSEGEPDLRPSQQRRAQALVELVRRAVAAGESVATTTKAQLFVTVDLDVLRDGLRGAGITQGGADAGAHLPPETVRRLACDASVVPVVLGGQSEVVDWGTARRLFTPAQSKRLWLRDGGCTYPGCTVPPQWCDVSITSSTGRTEGPPTCTTPRSCAACTTPSCTPDGLRDGSAQGPRSTGTALAAATTCSSPNRPPADERDPAPHPALTRPGCRHAPRGGGHARTALKPAPARAGSYAGMPRHTGGPRQPRG